MPIAITLHVLLAVLWVGGLFFSLVALRPAAAELLEPRVRVELWTRVLGRFFPWVWGAALLLPISGYWMILVPFEGFPNTGWHIHLMQITGWLMTFVFLHVYFAPYRRLRRAHQAQDWEQGLQQLGQIRRLVGINLLLGLITVVVATGGAYFAGYLASLAD